MMELKMMLAGIANTGDNANPWLIAICMIVSVVVVVGLIILKYKDKSEK